MSVIGMGSGELVNFLSLFTGVGGFDLGFQRAGMECVGMCEIEPHAQSVLKRRFPGVPLFDDVKQIGRKTHERGTIDAVCGGFPCQDLSIAGKRKGLTGERSGLWYEFARIIDELEPRWVVIENVPGLLSSNVGKDFAIVIGGLTGVIPKVPRDGWRNAGIAWGPKYKVCWRVLDSQYFGVPQRRRRVFIVASLGNGCAAQVLFEPTSLSGNTPPRTEGRQDVAYTLRADPSHSGDKGDGGINTTLVAHEVSGTLYAGYGTKWGNNDDFQKHGGSLYVAAHGQANAEVVSDGEPSLTNNHEAPILFDGRNMATHEQSPTLQAKDEGYSLNYTPMVFQQNTRDEVRLLGGDGDIAGALAAESGMKQQNYIAFSAKDNGRDVQEDVSPTLRSMGHDESHPNGGGQVAVSNHAGVRRLMPIETERLQGFPDKWTEFGMDENGKPVAQADSHRYKQMGNAVSVPPAFWIGSRIIQFGGKHE